MEKRNTDCGCGDSLAGLALQKAAFTGKASARVADLVGKCVLFKSCGCDAVLVEVEAIEYVRGIDNFLTISRLSGPVRWGKTDFDRVELDHRAQAKKAGWKSVKSFNDSLLGTPASDEQYYMRKVSIGTLKAGKLKLACYTGLEGVILTSGMEVSWQEKEKKPPCTPVVTLTCDTLFCTKSCTRKIEKRKLVDCICPESFHENPIGFCWVGTRGQCIDVSCRYPKRCRVRFPHRCVCA